MLKRAVLPAVVLALSFGWSSTLKAQPQNNTVCTAKSQAGLLSDFSDGTQPIILPSLIRNFICSSVQGSLALQSAQINNTVSGTQAINAISTWTGPFTGTATIGGPIYQQFNDASSNNNYNIAGFTILDQFNGTGVELAAARSGANVVYQVLGPSAPTGIKLKQYIGVNTNAAGVVGDGSVVTTLSSTCSPSTCTSGSVLPLTAMTHANGNFTNHFHVGDAVGVICDTGCTGPTHYWFAAATAVDEVGGTITISPALPAQASAGNAVWDLQTAQSLWSLAGSTINNPLNRNYNPAVPPDNSWAIVGAEFDSGSKTNPMWNRFGVLVSAIGDQQAIAVDAAFAVGSQSASGPHRDGLLFTKASGKAPLSADGAAILGEGTWTIGSFIDFHNENCSSYEIWMPGFYVDCTGLAQVYADQSATTTIPLLGLAGGGAGIGYNKAGQGETDVFNAKSSLGSGGVQFFEVALGGTIAGSPFFSVDSNGNLSVPSSMAAPTILANGAAGTSRNMGYQSSGVFRWIWAVDNTAEGGGNAGSNQSDCRYSDAGTVIDCPITIVRSTGLVTLADGEVISAGGINVTGGYKAAGTAGVTCPAGISATTGRSVNGIITAC